MIALKTYATAFILCLIAFTGLSQNKYTKITDGTGKSFIVAPIDYFRDCDIAKLTVQHQQLVLDSVSLAMEQQRHVILSMQDYEQLLMKEQDKLIEINGKYKDLNENYEKAIKKLNRRRTGLKWMCAVEGVVIVGLSVGLLVR